MTLLLGGLGGAVAYGVDWGISHAKIGAGWQLAAVGGTGAVGTVLLAKYGDERLAAGLAGGTVFAAIGRTQEVIALSKMGKPTQAQAQAQTPPQAAAVVRRGNPMIDARSMHPGAFGPSFKREAAAVIRRGNPSAYMPGPVRFFGPKSWVYHTESGAVVRVRSAHSR